MQLGTRYALVRLLRQLMIKLVFLPLITFFILCKQPIAAADKKGQEDLYEFYLITIGLGHSIESRYGHTILQVEDHEEDRSYFLNWGTFDFSDPLLPLNFFLGKLRYWVSNTSAYAFKYRYFEYEKRPVSRQKINLNPIQQKRFMQMIDTNLKGENIYFWYHFFYKNCATFPRDYLNALTNGAIEKSLSKPAGITFRSYVREYLNSPFFVSFFLDIVMNSTIDYSISQWEESFYPLQFSAYLSELPAFDEYGRASETMKLLSEPEILFEPAALFPKEDFRLPVYMSIIFLILIGLYYRFQERRIWKASFTIWSLISTVLSLTMILAWIFSEHEVLKHNACLWFFWPLDIFMPLALWLKKNKTVLLTRLFAKLHLVAAALACMLWLLGLIEQDIRYVLIYVLPAAAYFYIPAGFLAKR